MTEPREPGFYHVRQQAIYVVAYYAGMGLWYFAKHARPKNESDLEEIIEKPLPVTLWDDHLELFKSKALEIIEKHPNDIDAIIREINNLSNE